MNKLLLGALKYIIIEMQIEIILYPSTCLFLFCYYSCMPFDVVLPESELMLGCLNCSKETTVKVILGTE